MQSFTAESQLGASYINNQSQQVTQDNSNISVCSTDSEVQENLKSLLHERLNNKVYTTLRNYLVILSNTNIDSVHKILPKISIYNNEVARFIEDINIVKGQNVGLCFNVGVSLTTNL